MLALEPSRRIKVLLLALGIVLAIMTLQYQTQLRQHWWIWTNQNRLTEVVGMLCKDAQIGQIGKNQLNNFERPLGTEWRVSDPFLAPRGATANLTEEQILETVDINSQRFKSYQKLLSAMECHSVRRLVLPNQNVQLFAASPDDKVFPTSNGASETVVWCYAITTGKETDVTHLDVVNIPVRE